MTIGTENTSMAAGIEAFLVRLGKKTKIKSNKIRFFFEMGVAKPRAEWYNVHDT